MTPWGKLTPGVVAYLARQAFRVAAWQALPQPGEPDDCEQPEGFAGSLVQAFESLVSMRVQRDGVKFLASGWGEWAEAALAEMPAGWSHLAAFEVAQAELHALADAPVQKQSQSGENRHPGPVAGALLD